MNDFFMSASRMNLKITAAKGNLTVNQLWGLSLNELDTLAIKLEGEYKVSGTKSFLRKVAKEDEVAKLKFDIVFSILEIKYKESEAAKDATAVKTHNQKIMALIAEKQDEDLKGKSVADLTSMLK
ncbi:MAG: hypothetical protein KAH32_08400 [Chlamydiia bacterium]|nr:hypothetical protein [Chlamydiia bacterium]